MGSGEFSDDEPGDLDLAGFGVFGVDAVVALEGVGHDEDLAGVGGVGEGFLVADHGGVEDDLSGDGEVSAGGAEGGPGENRAILEGEAAGARHGDHGHDR